MESFSEIIFSWSGVNLEKSENLISANISSPAVLFGSDYRTRRNFRGGLIFVLFAGEVDPRKLMRTKIKNYGPSP